MSEIDRKIQQVKQGKSILQNVVCGYSYYLVYKINDFYLEKYEYNFDTKNYDLKNIECIDEETARFSLTHRFCNLETQNRCTK